ncbi:hypothetical protein NQ314_001203 [Rhamnusium bicolor]|uniref:DDE-1 domain-containing protein n=1 Tax=Rhamnusium bicolor TaxID=1586634 RepID=A0AAV8ZU67_9CUCU|nr:hypothetical protein NQ314_001203 [Rhamnusium bicolor]
MLPQKALLLVDNVPSHPLENEINFDPTFRVLFLPPNYMALLQPMNQNLIQNITVSYRKGLLNYIISHDDGNIVQLLKNFNIKNAVTDLDRA